MRYIDDVTGRCATTIDITVPLSLSLSLSLSIITKQKSVSRDVNPMESEIPLK